jgi:membrane protease YdiL (CAAX protease family)
LENVVTPQIEGKRWGFWATLGFSSIIVAVYLAVQFFIIGVLYGTKLMSSPKLSQDEFINSIVNDGFFLSISTIFSAWLCMVLIILFVAIRDDNTIRQYLNLNKISIKTTLIWLVGIYIFLIGWNQIYTIYNLEQPGFIVEVYKSASNITLLWIAIVIAAPVLEEFFFRGFLFDGLRDSKLGSVGAIIITAGFWGLIHQQYGTLEIAFIMILGVLFGIARIQTRSLYTPIIMHMLVNLNAMWAVSLMTQGQ